MRRALCIVCLLLSARADAQSREVVAEERVLLLDPQRLEAIERTRAPFWHVFGETDPRASGQQLSRESHYRSLMAAVHTDLVSITRRDVHAGAGMRHAHRLFDERWLRSVHTRFELVGIANRLDRRWADTRHCGELRFVYRLAYESTIRDEHVESRLPMTISLVFWQSPDDEQSCLDVAKRWTGDPWRDVPAEQGPLASRRLTREQIKSIEINFQSVRWPSTVRPDLAGHAEYALRVLHVRGRSLVPATLENTPDVARLRASPGLRRELLAWLSEPNQLSEIDRGRAVVPERFLARRATSVSPHGLGRLANRPWASLFSTQDLNGIELSSSQLRHVRTPAELLRRLDGMTCMGCHQTRALAGFHLLGEERDPQRVLDAMRVGASPHLDGDLSRRSAELDAMLAGNDTLLERAATDHERVEGGYGSHCSLVLPLTAAACSSGLVCTQAGDTEVGSCLPEAKGKPGDACELAAVMSYANAGRDHANLSRHACRGLGGCFTNRGGFPNGMCVETCGSTSSDTACGLIPVLGAFNACLARGVPFPRCIRETADPVAMRACDEQHACRDDYVCARTQDERGACLPTYFLFQLRVDGHVM